MKTGKKKKNKRKTDSHPNSWRSIMKPEQVVELVSNLAAPICDSAALELVHVEYQREAGGRTLRLYIDKPGGVSLDDCAFFSRQLGDLLDVSLEDEPYRLEVSSPGADRPLGKLQDFERFKGCDARITLSRPQGGQKNFRGILMGVLENTVEISVDSREIQLDYDQIVKARLINYNGEN